MHTENCGIHEQISCLVTSKYNGIAERKHQHIYSGERIDDLATACDLPKSLCAKVFIYAVFLVNILPSMVLKIETPLFKLFSTHPNYSSLLTRACLNEFGSAIAVVISSSRVDK